MWGRRLVQLQKRLVLVLSNSSRQCSSKPDVREFMGKGLIAIGEIDRLSPHTDFNDIRLKPLLKIVKASFPMRLPVLAVTGSGDLRKQTAKESFELALEIDKDNMAAILWLSRLHLYYNIPGACLRSGANLLETAADAGLAEAQYELACRIRSEAALLGDEDAMDDRMFKYLELAACQKHAGALFLVGSIYLSGKHVHRDSRAAAWCFRKAAEQGHIPAATVYASLVSKGANWEAPDTEEKDEDDEISQKPMEISEGFAEIGIEQAIELCEDARLYFDKAAEGGDPLALEWLTTVPHAKELAESST